VRGNALMSSIIFIGGQSAAYSLLSLLPPFLLTASFAHDRNSLAAYGVAMRIEYLFVPFIFSFSLVYSTRIGYLTGNARFSAIACLTRKALVTSLLVSAACASGILLFGKPISRLFTNSSDVGEEIVRFTSILAMSYPLLGISITTFCVLQISNSLRPLLTSLAAWSLLLFGYFVFFHSAADHPYGMIKMVSGLYFVHGAAAVLVLWQAVRQLARERITHENGFE